MSEWISVEDRLPEKIEDEIYGEVRYSVRVLAVTKSKFVFSGRYMWDDGCESGGIWLFDEGQSARVTHWMPLPEPPKESS